MFFDEVSLELEGGRGGCGVISFHREKFIDEGFPDGGDGGNGGSVILEADENYNTLQHFQGRKNYKADPGTDGHKNNRAGHNGIDLILKVPVGTLVINQDDNTLIVDLIKNKMQFVISQGGRGGYGNAHFVSSTRQAPKFAELGDIGELKKVKFEVRIVADVGLLGFPSAGKSTLISHLSEAKPKIGDYPFTTLVPNLGVVNLKKFGGDSAQTFVIADMPGIIEGASEGKGLGDKFLRHISRTATLIYLLDPYPYDEKTIAEQFEILQNEITKYDKNLLKKQFIVCVNKIDALSDEDRKTLKEDFLEKFPKMKLKLKFISAVSGENLDKLAFDLFKMLQKKGKTKEIPVEASEYHDYTPGLHIDEHSFTVKKMYSVKLDGFQKPIVGMLIPPEVLPERTIFEVTGKRIQQISRMTNTDQDDGVARVEDVLQKMKIFNELKKIGAKNGDLVKIEPHIYEFHDIKR